MENLTVCQVLVALARALRKNHVVLPPSAYPCTRIQQLQKMLEVTLRKDAPPPFAGEQCKPPPHPTHRNHTWWKVWKDFQTYYGKHNWVLWYSLARSNAEQCVGVGELEDQALIAAYSCADPRTGAFLHLRGLIADVISAHGLYVLDD
jgi:hypothetical protein